MTDVDAVDAAMARHPAGGGRSGPAGRRADGWSSADDHDAIFGRDVPGLPEGVHTLGALGADDVLVPAGFTWRGNRYRVRAVLSRWREDRSLSLDPNATDWLGEGEGSTHALSGKRSGRAGPEPADEPSVTPRERTPVELPCRTDDAGSVSSAATSGQPARFEDAEDVREGEVTGVADAQLTPGLSRPAQDARPELLQGRGTGVSARQGPTRQERPSAPTPEGLPPEDAPSSDPTGPARPERFPERAREGVADAQPDPAVVATGAGRTPRDPARECDGRPDPTHTDATPPDPKLTRAVNRQGRRPQDAERAGPPWPERFAERLCAEHWRVEALGPGGVGVYELCRRGEQWRLERVWD